MEGPAYLVSRPLSRAHFNYYYPEQPRTFGERVRKARLEAGLTANELAQLLGVRIDTVYNWEVRGLKPLNKEVRKKVEGFACQR